MALNTLLVVSQEDQLELERQHYFVRDQTLANIHCDIRTVYSN